MRIAKKELIVSDLMSKFNKSTVVVLAGYKGIDVKSVNSLRQKLKEVDSEFRVAKNSLFIRASIGNDVALIKDEFNGPSAVALCYGDLVSFAKVLTDFGSGNEFVKIKAVVLDGKILDSGSIKIISSLPSKDVLLSKLCFAMNAMPTSLVVLLSNVIRNFLYVLEALKKKNRMEEGQL